MTYTQFSALADIKKHFFFFVLCKNKKQGLSSPLFPVFSSAHSSCVSIYVKPPVSVSSHPNSFQWSCSSLPYGSPQTLSCFPIHFQSGLAGVHRSAEPRLSVTFSSCIYHPPFLSFSFTVSLYTSPMLSVLLPKLQLMCALLCSLYKLFLPAFALPLSNLLLTFPRWGVAAQFCTCRKRTSLFVSLCKLFTAARVSKERKWKFPSCPHNIETSHSDHKPW